MKVLEEVSEDMSLDEEHRIIAEGFLQKFSRKEIVATACLFNEIFAKGSGLHIYCGALLQRLNNFATK